MFKLIRTAIVTGFFIHTAQVTDYNNMSRKHVIMNVIAIALMCADLAFTFCTREKLKESA